VNEKGCWTVGGGGVGGGVGGGGVGVVEGKSESSSPPLLTQMT